MTNPSPASGHGAYRADIDGLRAVAVLSVVAFHVGFTLFGGGFVGVDIFFVISGYLITQILMREVISTGKVHMAEFYARRVRRLFPALAVVILATLAAAHFLLLPIQEQPDLARSTYPAAGYISNFYFENSANDYFAGPAEEQPLLHLWSLSVEEQYYLAWPALVFGLSLLARRLGLDQRKAMFGALGLLSLGSFALCVFLTAESPGIAFYYLPTRAWELGVGSLAAIGLDRIKPNGIKGDRFKVWGSQLGNVLSGVGLLALSSTVLFVDETVPFPGAIAAVPVLGTALCIAGGAVGSRLSDLLLGNRPMVWVGKLSYSLYLWHWPMLAIARTRALGEPNMARDLTLALAAVALAWGTLVWVENPIRYGKPGPFARRGSTLLAGAAVSLTLALGGYALAQGAIAQSRQPAYAELLAVSAELPPLGGGCQSQRLPLLPRPECTLEGTDPAREFVVWGDSHSDRAMAPVADFAVSEGIPVVQRTHPGCPPLVGVTPLSSSRRPNTSCARFNAAVFAELEVAAANGRQVVAVLVARWPNYLGEASPSGDPSLALDHARPDSRSAEAVALFEKSLEQTVVELAGLGIRSVIFAPVPEFRDSPPKCRIRLADEECTISRSQAAAFSAPATEVIERVAGRHPLSTMVVDAFDLFCDSGTCSPVRDNQLAYADPNHLTYRAAAALLPEFSPALSWAQESASLQGEAGIWSVPKNGPRDPPR